MAKLSNSERDIVYKSTLLLSTVTKGGKIPREFQLDALLALLAGWDCLIDAGTGSGKTLCMVLPALFGHEEHANYQTLSQQDVNEIPRASVSRFCLPRWYDKGIVRNIWCINSM